MPDYRTYLRNSTAPFDGVTDETAIYEKTGSYTFRTEDQSPVGVWPPEKLGRNDVISLVMASSNVAVADGDTLQHLNINNVLVQSVPFTPQQSINFLLMPTDKIAIDSISTSANIVVQDLTNEQYQRYINSQNIAAAIAANGISGEAIISAANIIALANTSGKITVYEMTGAAGQTITLPPLAVAAIGTTLIVWNSSADNHDIVPTGLEEINGNPGPLNSGPFSRTILYSGGPTIGWLTP